MRLQKSGTPGATLFHYLPPSLAKFFTWPVSLHLQERPSQILALPWPLDMISREQDGEMTWAKPRLIWWPPSKNNLSPPQTAFRIRRQTITNRFDKLSNKTIYIFENVRNKYWYSMKYMDSLFSLLWRIIQKMKLNIDSLHCFRRRISQIKLFSGHDSTKRVWRESAFNWREMCGLIGLIKEQANSPCVRSRFRVFWLFLVNFQIANYSWMGV